MSVRKQKEIYNKRILKVSKDFSYIEKYSLKIINKIFSDIDIKRICDIGCGSGKYINYLMRHYDIEYARGYDVSEESIKYADSHKNNKSVFYKVYDGFNFDNEKYDFIMINHVLEHVEPLKRELFLKNVQQLCHENTVVFIAVPNRNSFPEFWVSLKEFIKGLRIRAAVGHEHMGNKKDYDRLIALMFKNVIKDYDYSFSYRRMGTYVPFEVLFMPYKIIEKFSEKLAEKYALIDNFLTRRLFFLRYFSLSFYYVINKNS